MIKHERFVEDLIVTDEAALHMNETVNRQNARTYSLYGNLPRNTFESIYIKLYK